MDRVRAIVVDDEPLARERLRDLVAADAEVELVAECADGFEAVAAVRELSPDLLFLDVQMPEMDGFEVVAALGAERLPVTVFVTAHDRYALRAFEVHALDYLLKPFDEERFRRTLELAKARVREAQGGEVTRRLLALVERLGARAAYLERVTVKTEGRLVLLKAEEIDWIGAEGNYVRLHAGGAAYMLRETIGGLEARLDPARFARIHRSTVVNLDRVREIRQAFHGDYRVLLADGTELTLSRTYIDALRNRSR